MKAVILAAGEGKRLRPFTERMPKVMLPIGNKPILEHIIQAVNKCGINEIILIVGYKKEVIMEYFKEYPNIYYVYQDKQLGTAHALYQAKNHIQEQFIVLSGDNIIDEKSIEKLINDKSEYSLLIKEHPYPQKYGLVFLEKNDVKKIVEKPEDELGKYISTGIYKFPSTIFNTIGELNQEGIFDLTSVLQNILKHNKKINTILANMWMDVVYPWDLIDVNETIIQKNSRVKNGIIEKGVTLKGTVSIGKNTKIYSGCYIVGPVVIGEGCEIGPNACIFPATTIGNNAVISPFCIIRNSVLMNNVHIGSNSNINYSIIGRGTKIGDKFSVISGGATMEIEGEFKKLETIGSMIGEYTEIGSNVIIEQGLIIGQNCSIESLKHITKNVDSKNKVM